MWQLSCPDSLAVSDNELLTKDPENKPPSSFKVQSNELPCHFPWDPLLHFILHYVSSTLFRSLFHFSV